MHIIEFLSIPAAVILMAGAATPYAMAAVSLMSAWAGPSEERSRAKRLQPLHALVLATLLCIAPLSAAVAQTTVNAGDVTALPGGTAAVPISLLLPAATQCATLQFKLTVTGNCGAPAVTTNVTFASLVGAPNQNSNPTGHPEQVLVGWFSNFNPLLSGTAPVGTLTVPIPSTAQLGQTYTVQVLLPSGTTDGSTDLPMSGVNGTITIGGAPTPTATATTKPTNTGGVTATLTPTPTRTPIIVRSPTPVPTQVAVLAANITGTDTTIPVSDISPFPPDLGKIQIDQEIITYSGTQAGSGSGGSGGGAATLGVLLNAVRGAAGTTAAAHTAGQPVSLFPSGGGGRWRWLRALRGAGTARSSLVAHFRAAADNDPQSVACAHAHAMTVLPQLRRHAACL